MRDWLLVLIIFVLVTLDFEVPCYTVDTAYSVELQPIFIKKWFCYDMRFFQRKNLTNFVKTGRTLQKRQTRKFTNFLSILNISLFSLNLNPSSNPLQHCHIAFFQWNQTTLKSNSINFSCLQINKFHQEDFYCKKFEKKRRRIALATVYGTLNHQRLWFSFSSFLI